MSLSGSDECSVITPCHNCEYCQEYYRQLYSCYDWSTEDQLISWNEAARYDDVETWHYEDE